MWTLYAHYVTLCTSTCSVNVWLCINTGSEHKVLFSWKRVQAKHACTCNCVNHYVCVADFGPRQMENAAMLCSSWQRPPMLIDPNGDGIRWLTVLHHSAINNRLIILDMEHR